MFALVGVRGSISSKTVNKNVSRLTAESWDAHGSWIFKFALLIFGRRHWWPLASYPKPGYVSDTGHGTVSPMTHATFPILFICTPMLPFGSFGLVVLNQRNETLMLLRSLSVFFQLRLPRISQLLFLLHWRILRNCFFFKTNNFFVIMSRLTLSHLLICVGHRWQL